MESETPRSVSYDRMESNQRSKSSINGNRHTACNLLQGQIPPVTLCVPMVENKESPDSPLRILSLSVVQGDRIARKR